MTQARWARVAMIGVMAWQVAGVATASEPAVEQGGQRIVTTLNTDGSGRVQRVPEAGVPRDLRSTAVTFRPRSINGRDFTAHRGVAKLYYTFGRVSAIDPQRSLVVVREDPAGLLATGHTFSFLINHRTNVAGQAPALGVSVLQPGDRVKVCYAMEAGQRVARVVELSSPAS